MTTTPAESGQEALTRAREAVTRSDWGLAYEAYAEADSRLQLDPPDLWEWAEAAYLLGRVDVAVDALARAHHGYQEANDLPSALRMGFWLVFIFLGQGAVAQATGWLSRCSSLLDDLPVDSPEAAYLRLVDAFRLTAVEERHEEGHRTAMEVVAAARRGGEKDLAALGLHVAGRALIRAGHPGDGLSLLDEAMVAVVSGELSPPVVGTVYCSLIEGCEELADLERAREWTEALTRWCEDQKGMLTFTGQCLTHRATILRWQGRWEDAVQEAKRARLRFVGAADEAATGKALYELAEVYRVMGELGPAEENYRQASEWGHDPQPGLALLRLAQGNPESAAGSMRRLVSQADSVPDRGRLLPAHVRVMLAVGDVAEASAAAAELQELAGRLDTALLRAEADMALGAVAAAGAKHTEALDHLRRAREAWQSLDAPHQVARTRLLIGLTCREMDDQDGARLELDAARATFERLGARPDLEELAILDGDTDGGASPLSPRELEVLRLVATGMTNQEIADELFLAVKTVDRHVGNILTKLEVPSRTAATAYAYRHGMV